MCGIAGYFGKGSKKSLADMVGEIDYRGPDGVYFYKDRDVGIAQNRLAIVGSDYSSIIANENKNVILACNGEIYNYKKLKRKLDGHDFKTDTDTEVIVHLYEEYGIDFLKMIRGMFSLALYDKEKKKLFLARDKTGQKSLYWGVFDGTLIFSSELKGVAQHPSFKKEIDLSAFNKYLLYEYVPAPDTIIKGLRKLTAGSYLSYQKGNITEKKYWDYSFNDTYKEYSKKEILKRFDDVLEKSIDTVSPSGKFGIFLSGGIDSSTLVYYCKKLGRNFETLTAEFEEESFNEAGRATRIAEYFDIKNQKISITPEKVIKSFDDIYELLDEPQSNMTLIPSYFLSLKAKSKFKVCLEGNGIDELMCGYGTLTAEKIVEFYLKFPNFFRENIFPRMVDLLPTSRKYFSLDFKIKKFIDGADPDPIKRHHYWCGSFNRKQRKRLMKKNLLKKIKIEDDFSSIEKYGGEENPEKINLIIYDYLKTYLPETVCPKTDRSGMYNSVEVRLPFLDDAIIDFTSCLPAEYKMKRLKGKFLLENLMADRLPGRMAKANKKGFGVPIAYWIDKEFKPLILEHLSSEKMKKSDFFNHLEVEKILSAHFEKKANNYKLIWTLFVFQYWLENVYKNL